MQSFSALPLDTTSNSCSCANRSRNATVGVDECERLATTFTGRPTVCAACSRTVSPLTDLNAPSPSAAQYVWPDTGKCTTPKTGR